MAAKALLTIPIAAVPFLLICYEVGADGSAPSPISGNIGRTITSTKGMVRDVANSAAPKACEVGQAVKDTAKSVANAAAPTANKVGQAIKGTAKSAADSVTPIVDKAGDAAKETTNSLGSWFKIKLPNLGIISRGPAEPVRSPSTALTKPPASAPVKLPRTP